jgi:peptide/nickel transport system substrate-binding protein
VKISLNVRLTFFWRSFSESILPLHHRIAFPPLWAFLSLGPNRTVPPKTNSSEHECTLDFQKFNHHRISIKKAKNAPNLRKTLIERYRFGLGEMMKIHFDDVQSGTTSVITGKVLVIAMSSDVETMDPAKTSTMYGPPGMIYETLIARDLTGAYVPGLAESWELKNMRGTSYPYNAIFNITLKQGVKFHDGLAFNSDAVRRIFNYYAQNDSWVQYEFWCIYGCQNKTGWPNAGIWCRDDYHMTLNLTWADVALIFNLSHLYGSMISPDALESDGLAVYGTPGHKVVGTGPFILKDWVPGDHVTLVKNENYTWGASWYTNKGPAKIDKVIYRIIADENSRSAGFESGAIDILQQVPPSRVQTYAANSEMTVIVSPGQGTYHVDFNCQKAPWTNVSLRKAFGYAINRTQILESVWHGYGQEGVNYLPPIELEGRLIPAQYNFSYDPIESATLFAQAGFENRDSDPWLEKSDMSELTLNLATTNKGEDVSMSEIIKNQFEAMGVHVNLLQYEESTLRSVAAAGLHDSILFWYSWPRAEILDWEFGTWAMGGSNMAWFSDAVFDNFVTNWTFAETEQEFSDNATAGHIRLLTQAPRTPIMFWHQIHAIHNNVIGWYVHPCGQEQAIDIVDVDVDAAPLAAASMTPNPVIAGEIVTFDATGSSDDVGIVNWTWSFTDDGIPRQLWGEVRTYTVNNGPQDIDVTLTVRDGYGNTDTIMVTLEVTNAIPEFGMMPFVVVLMAAIVLTIEARRRKAQVI